MLLSGADPHTLSSNGRTAMWMASELGHRGIVRMLVEKCENGVDLLLNAPCAVTNEYPIHVATTFNKPEVVAVMLNLGADLTIVTDTGLTAMDIALRRRPTLDPIILLFGSYPERKLILDSAVRRQMRRDRSQGHSEVAERVAANRPLAITNGIEEDDDSRVPPKGKTWMSVKLVVIISACCTLVLSFATYQFYRPSAHHAGK